MEFFKNSKDELRHYDINGDLWFVLDDVLKALDVKKSDTEELDDDELRTINGKLCISEGGFYYLIIWVSKKPEAKEFAKWVLHDVVGSIFTKGYYKLGEEKND